jgi:hypothetical protein
LLVGTTPVGLAALTHVQIAIDPNQKLNSLVAVMRTVTSRGLFAEEYDEPF